MTPAQALAILPVFTAFANGADVQIFIPEKDTWVDINDPMFISPSEYRIKPVPALIPQTFLISTRQYLFNYGSDSAPDYRILVASEKELESDIESQLSFVKWIDDIAVIKTVTILVEKDSAQVVSAPEIPIPAPSQPTKI